MKSENVLNRQMAKLADMAPMQYLISKDAALSVLCQATYSHREFELAYQIDKAMQSIFNAVTNNKRG